MPSHAHVQMCHTDRHTYTHTDFWVSSIGCVQYVCVRVLLLWGAHILFGERTRNEGISSTQCCWWMHSVSHSGPLSDSICFVSCWPQRHCCLLFITLLNTECEAQIRPSPPHRQHHHHQPCDKRPKTKWIISIPKFTKIHFLWIFWYFFVSLSRTAEYLNCLFLSVEKREKERVILCERYGSKRWNETSFVSFAKSFMYLFNSSERNKY